MTKNPLQFALPGFDAAPEPTDRLFFAIFPDSNAATRLSQLALYLRDRHRLTGPLVAPGRLHVTLLALGDFLGLPQGIVSIAREAAATVAASPFEIGFDRAVSNRQLVLLGEEGTAPLTTLYQTLSSALEKAGLKVGSSKSNFRPHLTLLYKAHSIPEHEVESIGWKAGEFVLVHSLLGLRKHVPLGRWTLRAQP